MILLGYNISTKYPELPVRNQTIINTINPHSYCVAKKDSVFSESLHKSDLLLPDGIGIVWAAKVLKKKKIEKIAGFDIFLYLMKNLNDTNGSCFFLGSSENTLKLIKEKAKIEFPNVTVNYYSPPYKAIFSKKDSLAMYTEVNKHNPEVLFVGMTAPKQEKWTYQNKENINSKIICNIGAVFDFYAGTVKRPSQFWIKNGLEWLPRLIKEPRRLAGRNLISTPKFLLEIFSYKFFDKGFFS